MAPDRGTANAAGTVEQAIRNAHVWFEQHSGWAPPDHETIAEWMADGVCRSPDDCLVGAAGWCDHGLASWWLILSSSEQPEGHEVRDLAQLTPHPSRLDPGRPDYASVIDAHRQAVMSGDEGYQDPTTGLFVMTARYLRERGHCCDQRCRHCPFLAP